MLELKRVQAVSPINTRIKVKTKGPINETVTVVLMTDLNPNSLYPIHYSIQDISNNQYSFLAILKAFISQGYLLPGTKLKIKKNLLQNR